MSFQHHGEEETEFSKEIQKLFQDEAKSRKRFEEQLEGRAERSYSAGRVGPEDDGDLAVAIGASEEKNLIFLDFGKPVEWVGMPPEQAVELAQELIKKAREISKEPIRVQLY